MRRLGYLLELARHARQAKALEAFARGAKALAAHDGAVLVATTTPREIRDGVRPAPAGDTLRLEHGVALSKTAGGAAASLKRSAFPRTIPGMNATLRIPAALPRAAYAEIESERSGDLHESCAG